jgi:hypothetical protein
MQTLFERLSFPHSGLCFPDGESAADAASVRARFQRHATQASHVET